MRKSRALLLLSVAVLGITTVCGLCLVPGVAPNWVRDLWAGIRLEQASRSANGPVAFYGRLIDQDRSGVGGAVVAGEVFVVDGFERWHLERFGLETDQSGSFVITVRRGSSLRLKISKQGYVGGAGGQFDFDPASTGRHIPDPKNPVVFHMWKKGQAEALIEHSRRYNLAPDGRTYTVDLLTAKLRDGKSPDGDLWISIKRPAKVGDFQRFDWSYRMEVVGGGYICTDDPFMYRAPEAGYRPVLEFESRVSDEPQPDSVRRLYVRSRDGKVYAAITISVWPNMQGKAYFNIGGFVNPAGSRNLEPDPKTSWPAGGDQPRPWRPQTQPTQPG